MDERLLIVARLTAARKDLDEVVDRLTDGLLSWAPREGMRTVGGQLLEIVGTEIQVLARISPHPELSYDEALAAVGNFESLDNLKKRMTEVRSETLAFLNSLTADQLYEDANIPNEWNESLGLSQMPRGEVFRSIAQHEAYHTGQLVSYLWSRGDDPYSW